MINTASLTTAIDNASKVANTPLFTTVIDKLMGFRISQWAAEGELRKQLIHDEYQKAKESGIFGMQYIENLRHMTNLIDTAAKSAKYIDQNKPNDIQIDNDFFWNTIEHSKTISNEEMQELIAKIIAGEYNQPGTYSMSTLQTLKMLGKHELELFEKMCSLLIYEDHIPQEVFSMNDGIKAFMNSQKLDFGSLQILQNIGLFLPNNMSKRIKNIEKTGFSLNYFDRVIYFKLSKGNDSTYTVPSFYALSKTGKEIFQHLKPEFKEEYFNWLKKNYKVPNYTLIEN
jgi:hypothetical protein